MVDRFKQILAKLREKGNISLFVVLKMDDFVDKWSVVICGDWLASGDNKSFKEVFEIFDSILSTEEKNLVARIGIFSETDYIPQLFAKYSSGDEIKEQTKINGFTVYEGHIFESSIKEGKESGQEKVVTVPKS